VSQRSRKPKRRAAEPRASGTRLQKLIAEAGLASRREAEALILAGQVRVNGSVVRELGSRADPRRDRIQVKGRAIGRPARRKSYLVYKPRGVVTTTRDPHAKRTVLDLVPARDRLFPVGRLDAASEGLLLLTNDGTLAHALLHPSFGVERTYRVSVEGSVRADALRRLSKGIEVEGQRMAVVSARLLERDDRHTVLEIALAEGRKRQIRALMRAVGHPVRRLVRTRFGPLTLRGLSPGEWRPLFEREQRALERMVSEAERARERSGERSKEARRRRQSARKSV
jgi:23S rRNA pseudouridine2605 synthase